MCSINHNLLTWQDVAVRVLAYNIIHDRLDYIYVCLMFKSAWFVYMNVYKNRLTCTFQEIKLDGKHYFALHYILYITNKIINKCRNHIRIFYTQMKTIEV